MKKIVMGMAALLIAGFSFNASAQNDKTVSTQNPSSVCVQNCDSGRQRDGFKHRKDGRKDFKNRKDARVCPFADLNLTDAQKTKIENLNKTMDDSRKQLREQAKSAREKGDTTFNPRKSITDLRGKYLSDLSKILTPAQYNDFLKNYYINSGSHRHGHDKIAKGHRHGGKKFAHGNDGRRDGKGRFSGKRNADRKDVKRSGRVAAAKAA